jgi:hypothetical protein
MEEPVSRDRLHDCLEELRKLVERLMAQEGRWERARELLGRLRAAEAGQREEQLHLLREQGESAEVLSFLELYLRLPGDEELASSPEFREWALRQFTEEEVLAGLREMKTTGGLELPEFLSELEQIVAGQ